MSQSTTPTLDVPTAQRDALGFALAQARWSLRQIEDRHCDASSDAKQARLRIDEALVSVLESDDLPPAPPDPLAWHQEDGDAISAPPPDWTGPLVWHESRGDITWYDEDGNILGADGFKWPARAERTATLVWRERADGPTIPDEHLSVTDGELVFVWDEHESGTRYLEACIGPDFRADLDLAANRDPIRRALARVARACEVQKEERAEDRAAGLLSASTA